MSKLVAIILICFIFTGCSSKANKGDNRIVAEVNNYKMTVEDLKYELANKPYDNAYLLKTEEGRKEFIDRLLEKEVLLQDAQGQGLDREKAFMKSIEHYWEQALLKLLIERKSNEISGSIYVYDNEIDEYYKKSKENLPLSKVKQDIIRAIRQEKETKAMDAWVKELKKKSSIRIDDKILGEVCY